MAMRDYSWVVRLMKKRYRLRVRRWRNRMSGSAWSVCYSDGRRINWIEAPYPKTPISLAVFLHEVGHHAIGFRRYRVRCEEEYYAWLWAFHQMRKLGVKADARVTRRFDLSMQYAVRKALRRGAKRIPAPLMRFMPEAA